MTTDPVCGAQLDERQALPAGLTSDYLHRNFYFCSEKCKTRFDSQPSAFVGHFNEWEEWDIPDQVWKEN